MSSFGENKQAAETKKTKKTKERNKKEHTVHWCLKKKSETKQSTDLSQSCNLLHHKHLLFLLPWIIEMF